jgi:hypothetical protein
MRRVALALAAAALTGLASAPLMAKPVRIAPAKQDVAAIDAALDVVYAVISGPAGQPRDFARMKTLFTPDARLTAIGAKGLAGGTVDDYIARSGKFLVESGFTERALVNRIEVYGDLAHAWSSYQGTFVNADGSAGKVRGINSFQLVRQPDGRWLVQSIFWQAEAPGRPLPADMAAANRGR